MREAVEALVSDSSFVLRCEENTQAEVIRAYGQIASKGTVQRAYNAVKERREEAVNGTHHTDIGSDGRDVHLSSGSDHRAEEDEIGDSIGHPAQRGSDGAGGQGDGGGAEWQGGYPVNEGVVGGKETEHDAAREVSTNEHQNIGLVEVLSDPMKEEEVRDTIDAIKGNLTKSAELAWKLFNGRAWEALGLSSWAALCQSEFSEGSRSQLTRQVEVYALREELKPLKNGAHLMAEGALRPLTALHDAESRRKAILRAFQDKWAEHAREGVVGKDYARFPTGVQVERAVREFLPPKEEKVKAEKVEPDLLCQKRGYKWFASAGFLRIALMRKDAPCHINLYPRDLEALGFKITPPEADDEQVDQEEEDGE